MTTDLVPYRLTWSEVDPRARKFKGPSVLTVVTRLGRAHRVPARPAGSAAINWSEGYTWTQEMTRALVEKYGRWAVGWRWAVAAGGPVASWCCPSHSITTRKETLARVAEALSEWGGWLEELAAYFDREDPWDYAAAYLVTLVVERTGASDAWYGHCEQVLTWFLTHRGVAAESARAQVEQAIGGRFKSWIGPDDDVVEDVAERLAASLET